MFCKVLVFNVINVVKLDKILLIIMFKSGIKIIFFIWIRLINWINKNVLIIFRIIVNNNLIKMGLLGKNNNDIKIFNFVYFIVLVVVGFINLFCIICCIINFDKVSELFESRILIVLGIWFENKMFICLLFKWKIFIRESWFIFINKEIIVKIINKINKV